MNQLNNPLKSTNIFNWKVNKLLLFILGTILFSLLGISAFSENYHAEIQLNGTWKFSIGDDAEWKNNVYDDRSWDNIKVPARWEEEGYQGYNGYAWYRKFFNVPSSFQNRNLYLELGYVDDVDEVYFNGRKIGGSGSFPPYFNTAYNSFRKYRVPVTLVNFNGENLIAVRTYDAQLEGGIVRGDVKLIASDIAIVPDVDLSGYWSFNTARNPDNPVEILVPGQWENQGFYNYDGMALYSKIIDLPARYAKEKMIFLAGRIDDDDQLFINGELIGETGDIERSMNTDMHREYRNYFIPDGILKPGSNAIQIKVRDRQGEGGILEGSIGLITQENFIKYWRLKRHDR